MYRNSIAKLEVCGYPSHENLAISLECRAGAKEYLIFQEAKEFNITASWKTNCLHYTKELDGSVTFRDDQNDISISCRGYKNVNSVTWSRWQQDVFSTSKPTDEDLWIRFGKFIHWTTARHWTNIREIGISSICYLPESQSLLGLVSSIGPKTKSKNLLGSETAFGFISLGGLINITTTGAWFPIQNLHMTTETSGLIRVYTENGALSLTCQSMAFFDRWNQPLQD